MAEQTKELDQLTEEAQLLLDIRARYEAARDHASKWRKGAREDYAMYAGDHWSSEDLSKMIEQQRTPVTFNRSAILIDAVIGYEVNNRQETRFIGRTQGDAKVNEALSEAARYFRDQCDAEFEESDAFRDMAICGMGWTNDRLTDERNPEYDLVRDRVDPFEMYWDPSCKKPNLADMRYVFRKKFMDLNEVKAIFPQWDGGFVQAEWLNDETEPDTENIRDPRNSYNNDNEAAAPTRNIPVLEYQYLVSEAYHQMTHPLTGQVVELNSSQWNELSPDSRAAAEQGTIPHKTLRKNEWKRAFLVGGEIVKQDQPYPKGCTYVCVTGKRDRNKGYWFGLMKSLNDPQKWSNKFLAQIMHLINTNAKPGYDIEEGAVKNMSEFERKAARPGAINQFADGALQKGRVQRREMAGLPPDLANLLKYANDSMSDVSGVNQELLGMADREQAGVLEYQRKQSAVTLLAPLFDSFRRYRKISARCWLYFMQTYLTDGRLIRITQDKPAQPPQMPMQPGMPPEMAQQQQQAMASKQEVNVAFTKQFFDPNVAEYDVIIDQGASSPNLKEATWSAIQPLLQLMADRMGPQEIALVLEYSPLPESFLEKLRAIHDEQAKQPPPPDPKMEALKAKTQMDMQKTQAQIQADQQRLAMEQQGMQAEMGLKAAAAKQDAEIKKEQSVLDMILAKQEAQQQMQLEMLKAIQTISIQRQSAEAQAEANQIKTAATIDSMSQMTKAKSKAMTKGNGARKQ